MRWIRLAPMTAESLILCVAIYASCVYQAGSRHQQFAAVQQSWGAIRLLEYSDLHDGVRRAETPELYGPFDVWNGDYWRIPATALHHSSLLHLVLTLGAAWYLGSRLERYWGSFAMGLFLISSVCIPIMAQLCLGQAMMGFSGVVCAMLGALVVLRNFDKKVAEEFSEDAARIGVVLVSLVWIATAFENISLPSTAHLVGFAYGAIIAAITGGPLRTVGLLQACVVLVHIWLIPLLLLVVHPIWIGRYHWHEAVSAHSPQQAERSLARAVSVDQSLTGAWLRWSQLSYERGQQDEAWKRMVKGLSLNPSSAPLLDGARRLWRHFEVAQRPHAERVVAEFFGNQAQAWLRQIRANAPQTMENDIPSENIDESPTSGSEFALDRQIELPALDFFPGQHNPQRLKDPREQIDAVEGETL